jgi:hypothetical protein
VFRTGEPTGGGRWQEAVIDRGRRLQGISCPGLRLCVAVDSAGGVLSSTDPTGAARRWHRVVVAAHLVGISCASVELCVAWSMTHVAVSTDPSGDARAWTLSHPTHAEDLLAVVCPTAHRCVALAHEAGSNELDGLTTTDPLRPPWHAFSVDDRTYTAATTAALACPSGAFCAGVDSFGDALYASSPFASRDWTSSQPNAVSPFHLNGVSCISAKLCVAVDGGGGVAIGRAP